MRYNNPRTYRGTHPNQSKVLRFSNRGSGSPKLPSRITNHSEVRLPVGALARHLAAVLRSRARSPSAVSEARMNRSNDVRAGCSGALSIQRLEGSRPWLRRTRALWELNGREEWCPAVSGCCPRARQTTADAVELGEAQDGRGIKSGEAGKTRIVEGQGTERLRAPGHAKPS